MTDENLTDPSERPLDCVVRGWQPISTAPKDGTEILIVRADGAYPPEYRVAYWDDDDEGHSGFNWMVTDAASGFNHHRNFPTHWMPLPEAPNEKLSGAA